MFTSSLTDCSVSSHSFFFVVKGPSAEATEAATHGASIVMKMQREMISFIFPSNGAPVEWNRQGKTEVLGGKNLSQCHFIHQKIPHGLTWGRIRASAVSGRRLTAWATARPVVTHLAAICTVIHVVLHIELRFWSNCDCNKKRESLPCMKSQLSVVLVLMQLRFYLM
jgi:hypothetical protein